MYLKNFLPITAVLSLLLSGCSSYPDSAQGLAQNICEELKSEDLDGIKPYMSKETLLKMEQLRSHLETFFKSPEFENMKNESDCSKPTQIKELDHGRVKITFGTEFNVKVKVIDGQWKMVN